MRRVESYRVRENLANFVLGIAEAASEESFDVTDLFKNSRNDVKFFLLQN